MIYLDNAASAPVKPCALSAAMPFIADCFANPSSAHSGGRRAALAIIKAREQCAAALCCLPEEIYFTSGGTESDNTAIFSAAKAFTERRHIVTTAIEHPAVLMPCRELKRQGFSVTYLSPDSEGRISPEQVERAITSETALVSVMAANNEIGTLQPIEEIAEICRRKSVLFHTDAVQGAGSIPLDMRKIKADMLSLSAHKLGGIKGGGLLFVRKNTPLYPLIFGGGQERGIRSGTENTAAIVALGEALEYASRDMERRAAYVASLRDTLIERLCKIPRSRLNGSRESRLCGNVCFSFSGVQGESLVLSLDLMGVCASSGSACGSGRNERSHVLEALGLSEEWLGGSLRLTISEENTPDEIVAAADAVERCVDRLRAAVM